MTVFNEGTAQLARIDWSDDTYRITTASGTEEILDSIRELGIVNPPIFMGNASGPIIVSGFRRLKACRKLGWSEVYGRFVPPSQSPLVCARLAIAENALQRPLNVLEISRCYQLLFLYTGDLNSVAEQASGLGLPADLPYIEKVIQIARVSRKLQEGVSSGSLGLAMAFELNRMDPETASAFADLFDTLRPSLNKQREIVRFAVEIAAREDVPVIDLLRSDPVQQLLGEENTDRSRRARLFRTYLRKRRFPALSRAEDLFRDRVRRLNLGRGITLKSPPHFESPVYSFELAFRNLEELAHCRDALERVAAQPALREILSR